MIQSIHIIPVDDTHDHDLTSICACDPVIANPGERVPVYRHNAYDHREVIEEANRILGNRSDCGGWEVYTM